MSLTWACENAEVDRALRVRPGVTVPLGALRWRFTHASGPGGQGVNTADSRVELSVDLAGADWLDGQRRARAIARIGPRLHGGVLTVVATTQRSQLRNREEALRRLADILRAATAPPPAPRRRTHPTRGSVEARLALKHHRARVKRARQLGDEET